MLKISSWEVKYAYSVVKPFRGIKYSTGKDILGSPEQNLGEKIQAIGDGSFFVLVLKSIVNQQERLNDSIS